VRNIFGVGLRYLFLINSNLKLCVLLDSTNGANIALKDEGSFSFIYLFIKVEALCLCISDNLSIPSLEKKDLYAVNILYLTKSVLLSFEV